MDLAGLPVRLWILSDKERVLILVWDAIPRPPIQLDAVEDTENGRGLLLVEAISAGWDRGGIGVFCRSAVK